MEELQGMVKEARATYQVLKGMDESYRDLKERERRLERSHPASIRHKMLLAVRPALEKPWLLVWGRDGRPRRPLPRGQTLPMSFGEEANQEGFVYALRGMKQQAEEAFSLALSLDPAFPPALSNLALLYLEQ